METREESIVSFLRMTPEERVQTMKDNPPVIEDLFSANAYFGWSWKGCGFGQLSFSRDKDGKLTCMNECLSREYVRDILHAFADHIANEVELIDC